jgi:WD40 repeat protein/serine/threonine protein kinase
MDLTGKTLGRYKIISLLDKGAMGVVYKGYHTTLNRNVAVKVLHRELASAANFVERFEREASIVARLRHTNILQVYDFDTFDGMYYMVMELIDGPTLKAEMKERSQKKRPFNSSQIGYIAHALAAALDYAHVRNVIHRDIKPANIMFNEEGQIVITDFGIVHLMGDQTIGDEGMIIGTPAYMSPEQGQARPIAATSDIYSLGIVIYELVTGRLPFEADNPISLIMQHVQTPTPAPRQFNNTIPTALEQTVLKALAKDPGQRYQKAGEFAYDIRQAIGMSAEKVLWSGSVTVALPPTAADLMTADIDSPKTGSLDETGSDVTVISPADSGRTDFASAAGPYRGLFAFREEDARFFFGREEFTEQLLEQVANKPLTAVVGPSGSGKSSVVYAGLVAALRREGNWVVANFRPGGSPFQAVAGALLPLLRPDVPGKSAEAAGDRPAEVDRLASALGRGELSLHELLNQVVAAQPAGSRLLLIADQFEELFTLLEDAGLRTRFMDDLAEAVDIQRFLDEQTFSLVITLRADFLAQVLTHLPFANVLQDADVKLGPMSRQDLIRAVANPAKRLGVRFESGLVIRIVNDVGEEPGNLPLLEFALAALWERREGSQLTHAAYEEIGGVAGALARHANDVYTRLTPEEQRLARRAFVQMVKPGEGTEDTRRVATRNELTEAGWQLAQKLADERLVVTGVNNSGQETAEVVHEALIRSWDLLGDWMENDRNYRAWQERLRAAMNQWQASNEDEGALLRGAVLQQALEWSERETIVISAHEQAFIWRSLEAAERVERQKEEQRQRELEQAQALSESRRRQVRVVRTASIGLAIMLLLAVCGAVFAFYQRGLAQDNAAEAAVQATAAFVAQETAVANEHVAATRAVEAEIARGEAEMSQAEAENARATAEAARQNAEEERVEAIRQGRISLAQSLVSLSLATLEQNNDRELGALLAIEAWRFNEEADGNIAWYVDSALRPLVTLPFFNNTLRDHAGGVQAVAYSPDGRLLASGATDNTVRLWNLAAPGSAPVVLAGHEAPVLAVAFSPDGSRLVSAGEDATIRSWDPANPATPPIILGGHDDDVLALAVSRDGLLASSSLDGAVLLWNLADVAPEPEVLIDQDEHILGLAFSEDGQTLALAGNDRTVQLLELASGERTILGTHDSSVIAVTFAAGGDLLASGGADNLVRVWDLRSSGAEPVVLSSHTTRVRGLVFLPDGRLVSAGDDKNLIVWNLAEPGSEPLILPGHESRVRGLALAPDGMTIASANDDSTIRLWRVAVPAEADRVLTGHEANTIAVIFSEDGKTMFTSGADNNVRVWDTAGFGQTAVLEGHEARVRSLAVSNRFLASAGDDGTIRLWELANLGAAPAVLSDHQGSVRALRFTADGQTLFSAGDDGVIRMWDGAGQPAVFATVPAAIYSLAFDSAETSLVAGDAEGQIHIFALPTGPDPAAEPVVLPGHSARVNALAFSPDGQILASASEDMAVKLWGWNDLAAEPALLAGHRGGVRGLAFSPDGSQLVSTGQDLIVLVWNPNDPGAPPATLNGHTAAVLGVDFAPDQSLFATVSDDATIRLWRPLAQLAEVGCDLVRRNLSRAEWDAFFGAEPYRATCLELPAGDSS